MMNSCNSLDTECSCLELCYWNNPKTSKNGNMLLSVWLVVFVHQLDGWFPIHTAEAAGNHARNTSLTLFSLFSLWSYFWVRRKWRIPNKSITLPSPPSWLNSSFVLLLNFCCLQGYWDSIEEMLFSFKYFMTFEEVQTQGVGEAH